MKVKTNNPPFGRPHQEASGMCSMPHCRAKATHGHEFYGWICKKHFKAVRQDK